MALNTATAHEAKQSAIPARMTPYPPLANPEDRFPHPHRRARLSVLRRTDDQRLRQVAKVEGDLREREDAGREEHRRPRLGRAVDGAAARVPCGFDRADDGLANRVCARGFDGPADEHV